MFWKTEKEETYTMPSRPEIEEPPTYDYKVTVVFKDGSVKSFLADFSYDMQGNGRVFFWQDALVDGKECAYYVIPVSEVREVMEEDNE